MSGRASGYNFSCVSKKQPCRTGEPSAGLPTSRLQSKISDFLLYCRLLYYFFYICLKPRLLCTFHHKTTSKHPEFKNFDSILQKNSVTPDKNEKSASPSWQLLCLGRSMACGNAYVKHFTKFPDFFETPRWQPGPSATPT